MILMDSFVSLLRGIWSRGYFRWFEVERFEEDWFRSYIPMLLWRKVETSLRCERDNRLHRRYKDLAFPRIY